MAKQKKTERIFPTSYLDENIIDYYSEVIYKKQAIKFNKNKIVANLSGY